MSTEATASSMDEAQKKVASALDCPKSRNRMLGYAYGRLSWFQGDKSEEAMDLVCEAVSKIVSGERKWDQDANQDTVSFICSVVKSLAYNRWKKLRNSPEDIMTFEQAEEQGRLRVETDRTNEGIDTDEFVAELIEETKGDDLCQKMIELIVFEDCTSREIADRVERPVQEIYDARKRLDRKMKAVAKRMEERCK